MRVLHVNTRDSTGGAAKVARMLMEGYRDRGHRSWMAVGVKHLADPDVVAIDNAAAAGPWARPWWRLHDSLPLGSRRARTVAASLAAPGKVVKDQFGIEDFEYPGTRRLLDLVPEVPDIVHLHNLHGRYFDLRELRRLSQTVPVVVTLHDPWMLTGHCAYPLDCERWRHGCGSCPHLDVSPAMRRDNTARNWSRKRGIYRDSSIFVAAPSRWLLERAEASILSEAIVGTRLIPNGVDLSIFRPGDKAAARAVLGLPQDDGVLLFSGFSPVSSSFKDFASVKEAARILGTRDDLPPMTLVVLGEQRPTRTMGSLTLRFVPIETDQIRVARFHQAADIYVHAAKVGAENHSLTVIEALACGTPVVATAVGGIPEQVLDLSSASGDTRDQPRRGTPTGILAAPNDPAALADAVALLLTDQVLARLLSANAEQDARQRFDLERQVGAYLDWYREIIGDRPSAESVALPDRGPSSR